MTTENADVATASPSTAATKTAAGSWVEMFAKGWANPVDADRFADHFEPHLAPDCRMIQPSMRPIVGRDAFREEFARPLFDMIPDLHGTVEGWASDGDAIYIELRLEGTVGRRPFTLRTCDRITLRDGMATERVAYLDATPLLQAVARSPRAWPKFVKTQLRSLRRPA